LHRKRIGLVGLGIAGADKPFECGVQPR
jgi:hypothetical protein